MAVPSGVLSSHFPAPPSLCLCDDEAEHWLGSSPSRTVPLLREGNLLTSLLTYFFFVRGHLIVFKVQYQN
jgi:hypothetical protein